MKERERENYRTSSIQTHIPTIEIQGTLVAILCGDDADFYLMTTRSKERGFLNRSAGVCIERVTRQNNRRATSSSSPADPIETKQKKSSEADGSTLSRLKQKSNPVVQSHICIVSPQATLRPVRLIPFDLTAFVFITFRFDEPMVRRELHSVKVSLHHIGR
ncbi:hypothetical protein OUZ56_030675 [Daphnia magna]|uniref:Uncharacterized protein n=1 Tax=Daphnia magna TaxID=35525 RepID=A0ABQ9ZSJ4_9CRUS|nr:hypothetical protein OUZ56_030675 [Daphnia magna]